MSSALLWLFTVASTQAHEVLPSIADMRQDGDALVFDVRLNAESFLAGINQTEVSDTNEAPQAEQYDAFRALEPEALAAEFETFWPQMAERITVSFDGAPASPDFVSLEAGPVGNIELPRTAALTFRVDVPAGAERVVVGWDRAFGVLVLRQMGVEAPYDGYLEAGAQSDPIRLTGGDQAGALETFIDYIPVGFDHIVPLGLDHILFVLGLFLLSMRMGSLLWQVTAFTLAHTITLALAALGLVVVPGSIVEPLIALSIAYVAIENLFADRLSPWRPAVIFGFGLLHGLGFASVLAEFGLPEATFIPALIGFNIGVEVGQLAVIAVAYLCCAKAMTYSETAAENRPLAVLHLVAMVVVLVMIIPLSSFPPDVAEAYLPLLGIVAILLGFSGASILVARFDSYREMVSIPGSILIAVVAVYWCVERVFL